MIKGVPRFGKKGKLKHRFMGPFEILDKIRDVAYLPFLLRLSIVHNVFYVLMLRKYVDDHQHVISYDSLEVQNLTYERPRLEIIKKSTYTNTLRNKRSYLR